VPSGNLLVNPGAEAGPGAADSRDQTAVPGWTVESTFTAVQYGAPAFLTAADSAALGGGVNFFAGGPAGAASAGTQVVDVSGAAAEIDAGKVAATLSALLGGYSTQTDHASVTATFLNAAGAPAGAVGLPTVTPADRKQVTALVARTASAAVPAGTRQISVRIDAVRDEGSYNDGYIDNVSLVRGPERAGRSSTGRSWSRGQRQGPHPAAGQQRLRRPHGQRGHPARFHGGHAGGRGGAHVGAQGGRQAAGQPVLRGRLQGHAAWLGHEPRADRALASCAAAAAAPRRPRRSSATSRATGRARSVRRASTARPPSGARSGWSRTAAPAP
jgi:hypothetical protein